jgi:hypothetical protein
VVFYLGNYVAYAATTKIEPGQSLFSSVVATICALLFPTSGIYRGLKAILSCAIFAKTDLQMTARVGALCMVIVDQRKPSNVDKQSTHSGEQFLDTMEQATDAEEQVIEQAANAPELPAMEKNRMQTQVSADKERGLSKSND